MATSALMDVGGVAVTGVSASAVTVRVLHDLDAAAPAWHRLASGELESPGQSLAFTRAWVAALGIAPADQFYLVAEGGGEPVALLPLWRRRINGVRMLTWFPGSHVGCNAPLVDPARLGRLGPDGRAALWQAAASQLRGVDLVYLKALPPLLHDGIDLFAELGRSVAGDTLFRSEFGSWDEADKTQRNKSRRKHDRQQGERLDALGRVSFDELCNGPEAVAVLDTMFRHRAARFVAMGVDDPFVRCGVREFYEATVAPGSGVDVRLHVLRLDGEIVAVRYNIAEGTRLFCLISSMSDDPAVQAGSPGKQCLLRVMQTVFDAGYRVFDMGAGFTDEKRHWCNVQLPLRHHYLPLTPVGHVAAVGHRGWQLLRRRIKSDERLNAWAKALRTRVRG